MRCLHGVPIPLDLKCTQEGKGVLVEHDGALFSVKMKRPKTKKRSRVITSQDSILHIKRGSGSNEKNLPSRIPSSQKSPAEIFALTIERGGCLPWFSMAME
jgi:hypothetical protein